MLAELQELRSELADISNAVPPTPVQLLRDPASGPGSEQAVAAYNVLLNKHTELTLYTKKKNLEMRRMLNLYKTVKTQFGSAGVEGPKFVALYICGTP